MEEVYICQFILVFLFNVWRKEKNMEIRARPKGLIFVLVYKERETKQ